MLQLCHLCKIKCSMHRVLTAAFDSTVASKLSRADFRLFDLICTELNSGDANPPSVTRLDFGGIPLVVRLFSFVPVKTF